MTRETPSRQAILATSRPGGGKNPATTTIGREWKGLLMAAGFSHIKGED